MSDECGGNIMNRKAFNRINYGLFIVAAAADGKRNGCIVNSLHQVTSSSPYKFSLTVNKSNETFKTIEAAGSFAATVLAKDTPKDLVDLFGYKSGRVVDKFEGFDVQTDEAGNPYVKDHALARISCKIVEKDVYKRQDKIRVSQGVSLCKKELDR